MSYLFGTGDRVCDCCAALIRPEAPCAMLMFARAGSELLKRHYCDAGCAVVQHDRLLENFGRPALVRNITAPEDGE